MKLDLSTPGAAQQEPKKESAGEQLEAPVSPLKKDAPAGALNPEVIAYMNSAIRESIASIMGELVPVLRKLNEPSPIEKDQLETLARTKERMVREKKNMMAQEAEARQTQAEKQRQCGHIDQNGKLAVSAIHNFPDRRPRGFCSKCTLFITPKEYRVAPPSVETLEQAAQYIKYVAETEGIVGIVPYENPKTHKISHLLWPEHPLYRLVLTAEAAQGVVG